MTTLAIDQGTTSTRALLVDDEGRVTTIFARAHRQIYPAPGRVEHDPEELIANLEAALAAAAAVPDLAAIGLDNQGESCLAWDAATGEAVSPVIVWQDDRTADVTARLAAEGHGEAVRRRAGLPLDPYFSASKLGWIVAEIPAARALLAAGRLRLGTTDAFFRDRLAGRFETDPTTASRTSLMNLATLAWDPVLCGIFGVPIEALPAIRPTTGDLGAFRVGGRAVPLAASLVDQQASLYGHGCRRPGDAKITFGTGAFALAVTERPPAAEAGRGTPAVVPTVVPTVAWAKAGETPLYALDGGVACAASAVDWARGLGLFGSLEEIGGFAAAPAIGRGLVFVPALAGLAAPHWDRRARGAWLGLTLDTTPADMMQAVLEGIAFRTAEAVAAIEAEVGLAAPIPIDGGMTANPYFCRFLAAVLGRKLLVSDEPELTAVGAAALAAEAVGRPFPTGLRGRRVVPEPIPGDAHATFTAAREAVQRFGGGGELAL